MKQPQTTTNIAPAAFKLRGACDYCGGLSPATLRRLIERGEIKRLAGVRHIVITKAELDRFLAKAS